MWETILEIVKWLFMLYVFIKLITINSNQVKIGNNQKTIENGQNVITKNQKELSTNQQKILNAVANIKRKLSK